MNNLKARNRKRA